MCTNDMLDREMETILQGKDTLEGNNFYIKYNFLTEEYSITSLSGQTLIFAVLKVN